MSDQCLDGLCESFRRSGLHRCPFCRDARDEDHPVSWCSRTHRQSLFFVSGRLCAFDVSSSKLRKGCAVDRMAPLPREEHCPFWTKTLDVMCGIPWDSLTCELRAFAGLLPLLKGGLDQPLVPQSLFLGCLPKGCFFATRTAPVSPVARHGRVVDRSRFRGRASSECARKHPFQHLRLADRALAGGFQEMENEEVPDFPEICAELLSVDVWHLVDCGRFVRDAVRASGAVCV